MKKALFFMILSFMVFSLAGVAYSWQGRMAGMGDPYGLVTDESDFLIHPAGIADGKGINFYGGYRFNYRDVTDWDYTFDYFTGGIFFGRVPYRSSGDEQEHNGLLGAAFPLGPGRMGLFFEYAGKRGDYDGRENETIGFSSFIKYRMASDLDSFALRLLYGLPMGGFNLGGEIQLAYRQEENKNKIITDIMMGPTSILINYPAGEGFTMLNLIPFMVPYDSNYWEALLKGSLKGAIGPAEIAFTMHGGFIFSGDNKYKYKGVTPFYTSDLNMEGNIKGWNVGGDLWLRYPLAKALSLPLLVKIEYQEKTRDGDGPGFGSLSGNIYNYKNGEKIFQTEVGGGLDKELSKGMRIAAGIYYNYIKNKNTFFIESREPLGLVNWDHSKYPDQTEHRVILKLAGEKEISPMFAMRMGLNFFYGWVKQDIVFNYSDYSPFIYNIKYSLDGSRWGIGASLGGTVKFQRFSFEPFVGGGYQKINVKGDGNDSGSLLGPASLEVDKLRKEWSVGGGVSIKY